MARFAPEFTRPGASLIGATPQHNGPGSNGYWERADWMQAGSYTFTAPRTGWYKIDAVGAGESGAREGRGGAAGGRSIKEIYLYAGDEILVTIGAGGAQCTTSVNNAGGTTTVACAARGLLMTVTGGNSTGGQGTGGDINLTGGESPATVSLTGGASAPSHYRNGFAPTEPNSSGCGVGGVSGRYAGGASSHRGTPYGHELGASGLTTRGGEPNDAGMGRSGEGRLFWDLSQVDGAGGAYSKATSGVVNGGDGGPGAGGGGSYSTSGKAGTGGILAGGGHSMGFGGQGGNGGGGGGGGSPGGSNGYGGPGGDGVVFIFWNEVIEREAA